MGMPNVVTPDPSQYAAAISTNTTTTIFIGVGAVFDGLTVTTAGTGSTVTVYDNSAASGTVLINAAPTTTANQLIAPWPGDGIACKSGSITIVTAGTGAATILPLYSPSIP